IYRKLPPAITMPYAKPAQPPAITDASGIPPPQVLDSSTRKNSDPNYPFGPNWAVYLLPYVEQNNLFQQASVSDYLCGYYSGNTTQRDRWRTIVKDKLIPVYSCPADDQSIPFDGYPSAPGPWARGNYAANAGPGWWPMSLR